MYNTDVQKLKNREVNLMKQFKLNIFKKIMDKFHYYSHSYFNRSLIADNILDSFCFYLIRNVHVDFAETVTQL